MGEKKNIEPARLKSGWVERLEGEGGWIEMTLSIIVITIIIVVIVTIFLINQSS